MPSARREGAAGGEAAPVEGSSPGSQACLSLEGVVLSGIMRRERAEAAWSHVYAVPGAVSGDGQRQGEGVLGVTVGWGQSFSLGR